MFRSDDIVFKPDTHQYFNLKNEEYRSVSRLLDLIRVPFNRDMISQVMARKVASETGRDESLVRKELLKEWEDKKNSSIDKGNYIHDGLENYAKTGTIWSGLEGPVAFMQEIFRQYYRFYPEIILYSHKHRVAGRTDLILQRQKSKDPVLDVFDYKSNESKGIVFDSATRKEGVLKHYNKFFLPPFDYLEDCNYNSYALQISIYAYLIMSQLGYRIGKLGIIFFDNNLAGTFIPVPFMYHEAKMLCEMNVEQKALPELDGIFHEALEKTMFPKNIEDKSGEIEFTDDWE